MSLGYIILGLIVVAGGYLIYAYNALVSNKNLVAEGWSGIDVQLRRRADLIPNLIETVKGYAAHEDKLFRDIADLRAKSIAGGSVAEQSVVGQAMSAALGRLFAIAEAYPDLKANENFLQLQSRITALENAIADRRELYNEAVNINNVRIEQFPDSIIAGLFRFGARPLLEFASAEKADVDMKALFS